MYVKKTDCNNLYKYDMKYDMKCVKGLCTQNDVGSDGRLNAHVNKQLTRWPYNKINADSFSLWFIDFNPFYFPDELYVWGCICFLFSLTLGNLTFTIHLLPPRRICQFLNKITMMNITWWGRRLHQRHSVFWMLNNDLKLNADKTKFLIIGTLQQLGKLDNISIRVGDTDIHPMPNMRNLDTWFDSRLSMATHITKIYASSFYYNLSIIFVGSESIFHSSQLRLLAMHS